MSLWVNSKWFLRTSGKTFFRKRAVILMGDFKINLFNCNIDKNTSDYVDILYFHASILQQMLQHKLLLLKNFN